jgi:hypothetical protein
MELYDTLSHQAARYPHRDEASLKAFIPLSPPRSRFDRNSCLAIIAVMISHAQNWVLGVFIYFGLLRMVGVSLEVSKN